MAKFKRTCDYCLKEYDPILPSCPHCNQENDDNFVKETKHIVPCPTWKQIVLFLAGSIGFIVLSTLISIIAKLAMGITDKSSSEQIIIYSTIVNCVSYAVLIVALLLITFTDIKKLFLSFKSWKPYVAALVGVAAIFVFNILYNLILGAFNVSMSDNDNEASLGNIINIIPVISIIVFGLIGPICEELTYRVGLFSFFKRINKWLPYIITILIFAFIHFDFNCLFSLNTQDGVNNLINELLNMPFYLFAGFTFSFLYDKFGFAASLSAHALNNIISIVSTIISTNK